MGFAGIALALIAVPGPDWIFVLGASTKDRVVLPPVLGLMLGYVVLTALVAVGAGPIIANVPVALTLITIFGACYLVYLGVSALRSKGEASGTTAEGAAPAPDRGHVVRGMGVSGFNPKGLLLFVAVLPQFASPDHGWPLPLQLGALGILYVALAGSFYTMLGFGAGRLFAARPRIAHLTTRVAGVAMIIVGLGLVAEHVIAAGGIDQLFATSITTSTTAAGR